MIALGMMTALLIKHFIMDFPLQRPYMLEEKGTYLARGGIHHAACHVLGTILALMWFLSPLWVLYLAILDGLIHYHVDWTKMKLGKRYGWTPANQAFWTAIGADQLAHQLTYLGLVWLALTHAG